MYEPRLVATLGSYELGNMYESKVSQRSLIPLTPVIPLKYYWNGYLNNYCGDYNDINGGDFGAGDGGFSGTDGGDGGGGDGGGGDGGGGDGGGGDGGGGDGGGCGGGD
jgi:hypothetical protein